MRSQKNLCSFNYRVTDLHFTPQRLNYSISSTTKDTGCHTGHSCCFTDGHLLLKMAPANTGVAPKACSQGGLTKAHLTCSEPHPLVTAGT